MEKTGERMIPEIDNGYLIYSEHIVRYIFAKQFIKNKRVLDVACGTGYGSKILKEAGASHVLGVDISSEAIEEASKKYSSSEIEFLQGNAENLDAIPTNSFDVIVSFETIEHLNDYQAFLREVSRILKKDGIFIVSTPNKAIYPPGNPFHIKEFYIDEFHHILQSHFSNIHIENQSNVTISALFEDISSISTPKSTIIDEAFHPEPMYIIAVCGNSKLKEIRHTNYLSNASSNELSQLLIQHKERIDQQEANARYREEKITNLEQEFNKEKTNYKTLILKKNQKISAYEALQKIDRQELQKKEEEIANLHKKQKKLDTLSTQIVELQRKIDHVVNSSNAIKNELSHKKEELKKHELNHQHQQELIKLMGKQHETLSKELEKKQNDSIIISRMTKEVINTSNLNNELKKTLLKTEGEKEELENLIKKKDQYIQLAQEKESRLNTEKEQIINEHQQMREQIKNEYEQERRSLERAIMLIKKSWSWKLSAPIRLIGRPLVSSYHITKKILPLSWRIAIGDFFIKKRNKKALSKKVDIKPQNLQENDLISVITPIYDRTWELKESIKSILNQSHKNLELILVTDGSPEKTIEIVEQYRNHPKVRIFHYYNNTGNAVRGRNKGIKEARGEFIAFQDSDDIAESNRLELSLSEMKKHRADIIYGGWRALLDGTREIDGIEDGKEVMSPDCDEELLREMCVPCQSTVMVRKSALHNVGGLKTKMKYREDHELWLRLAKNGYKFKAIQKTLTNLRLHAGNNELNFKNQDDTFKNLMLEEYTKKTELPKKIAYVVPCMGISGGIAVVLQHANRLLKKGYDVLLINQGTETRADWFPNNQVPIIPINQHNIYAFQNIDILIATGWQTVDVVKDMTADRKVYFVQSDERRFSDELSKKKEIHETYLNNFEYMTEAKWIQRWLKQEFNHDAYYVPNGLDKDIFHKTKPIERKPAEGKCRVLLEGPIDIPFKGMKEAYEAIKDLDCEIWIISTAGKPKKDWRCDRFFEAVPMQDMKSIYSACDIFLKMSRVEGFFGPPLEAMACGCAVVVGAVTGYDEYIINRINALVVESNESHEAKECVRTLMAEQGLRESMVKQGYVTTHEWSWDRSIELLEEMIKQKPIVNHYTNTHPNIYGYEKQSI